MRLERDEGPFKDVDGIVLYGLEGNNVIMWLDQAAY